MSFKSRAAILVLMSAFILLLTAPISAQDAPAPDPLNLAARLLGFSGEPDIPMPSPVYKVGDKLQFWVNKAGQDTPVQITAELAGDSQTAYVWVEQGTSYDAAKRPRATAGWGTYDCATAHAWRNVAQWRRPSDHTLPPPLRHALRHTQRI